MKITVIGAGTWGTALAILLSSNGHNVSLVGFNEEKINAYIRDRRTIKNLPGAIIPDSVFLTADLREALAEGNDIIVIATASIYVRETARLIAPYIAPGQIIVDVAKGIEENTLFTMSEVIRSEIPDARIAVMSGPTHAEEVSVHIPSTIVVGAKSKTVAETVCDAFMNDYFRVYTSPDVTGIELGGSLKNVIALAAGVTDGLGFGDNTKAALITRGIAEITRLGIAIGGRPETFAGLSGIGDLIVTCTSTHSRNRNAGFLIGQGKSVKDAMKEVGQAVEGVYSAKAAFTLAQKYNVNMPITEQVNYVLFSEKSPKEAVFDLFTRDKKTENENLVWEN